MTIEGMASKPLTIVLRIAIVEGMASMIEFLAFEYRQKSLAFQVQTDIPDTYRRTHDFEKKNVVLVAIASHSIAFC